MSRVLYEAVLKLETRVPDSYIRQYAEGNILLNVPWKFEPSPNKGRRKREISRKYVLGLMKSVVDEIDGISEDNVSRKSEDYHKWANDFQIPRFKQAEDYGFVDVLYAGKKALRKVQIGMGPEILGDKLESLLPRTYEAKGFNHARALCEKEAGLAAGVDGTLDAWLDDNVQGVDALLKLEYNVLYRLLKREYDFEPKGSILELLRG